MSLSLSRLFLGGILVAESAACAARWLRRGEYYRDAQARAAQLRRPLVVIGDPNAGAATRLLPAAGSGDVCIDLYGCPSSERSIQADITQRVREIQSDSAVVFVSCVLEYVDDIEAAWQEILRMAGSVQNVFIVTVEPWTITATLYPHAKWMVYKAPPDSTTLVARPVTTARKIITAGSLAGLTYLSIEDGKTSKKLPG